MPLKVGLSLKPKGGLNGANKPTPAKRKALFNNEDGSDQEDDETTTSAPKAEEITTFDEAQDAAAASPRSPPTTTPISKPFNPLRPSKPSERTSCKTSANLGPTLSSTLSHKSIASTAESLDPSIYDYDAHFATTSSTAASAARRAAAQAQAASGTPQYMESMLASAKTRERDQLRAKDKMLQKEREAEGDELKDTEQFVTGAYREQQEEVRRAEEQERKKEEAEVKGREEKGMRGFWKEMMDGEEERHRKLAEGLAGADGDGEEMVEDAMGAEEKEQAATRLAMEMNAKGANVVINEDGLVADKRQLLTAGLNITPTPRAAAAASSAAAAKAKAASQQKRSSELPNHQRRDAREAQRDRQTRMMEAQLEASQKRAAEEEAEALQKREMASKSQKTGAEISSAKERYLQRKREAEAAKARGET